MKPHLSLYKIAAPFFVVFILFSGQAISQSLRLQKGDSVTITVKAIKRLNRTGIIISRGETYKITATGKWQDAGFEPTDAEGFPSKNAAMRFARLLKPMHSENYLKLVAKIGSKHWPVGNSVKIHFEKNGRLILQPNDAMFFFGNNSGVLTVTIKRID